VYWPNPHFLITGAAGAVVACSLRDTAAVLPGKVGPLPDLILATSHPAPSCPALGLIQHGGPAYWGTAGASMHGAPERLAVHLMCTLALISSHYRPLIWGLHLRRGGVGCLANTRQASQAAPQQRADPPDSRAAGPAQMKKKVDARVRALIEASVASNHRGLYVIVGDKGRHQVPPRAKLFATAAAQGAATSTQPSRAQQRRQQPHAATMSTARL
jgi:hypothetical protein